MTIEILKRAFESEDDRTLEDLFNNKLAEVGISQTQFEKLNGIQHRSLDNILKHDSKQTDIVHLLKLSEFLELNLTDLLVFHFKNKPKKEIQELQNILYNSFINKYFDLKTLYAIKFINKNDSIKVVEERICNYFGINSVYDYDKKLSTVLYSKTKRSFSNKMKDFWVKSSYKYFESINNPNEYRREDLIELIPKIKPYTQNVEKGLLIVFQALYNAGITVVFQPTLPKVQVRGATFIVNNKPCIAITDLNKNYATVWFTLIHELHHVLFDMETIEKTKYHLSGGEEPDLFLMHEDKANEFAAEFLLSSEKLRFIEKLINNPMMVRDFAKECQIHPCIIYSQFQWHQSKKGKNYWGAFKEFFPDLKITIESLKTANWGIKSIEETSVEIKNVLTVNYKNRLTE